MDIINVSSPNDGLGDKLRDAMVKVNANFAELLNTINTLDFSIAAIDGLQDSLNTLSSNISGLQSQINTLDGRVDNNDSDISTINSNIVTINNTISEILNDLASQETELTDYQTTTNTLLAGLQSDLSDLYTDVQNLQLSLSQYELLTNKATNFSVINNTKYPTTSAVQNYVVSAIAGITGATGTGVIPNLTQVLNVGNTSSGTIEFSNTGASASYSSGGGTFNSNYVDGFGVTQSKIGSFGTGIYLSDEVTHTQLQQTSNYIYLENTSSFASLTVRANGIDFNEQRIVGTYGSATFSLPLATQPNNTLATENYVNTYPYSGFATASYNFAIGDSALDVITSGTYNMGLGGYAGNALTSGSQNMFIGQVAGALTQTGSRNTAIGCAALYYNIGGGFNTAIGNFALYSTIGSRNTAIGAFAGSALSSGEYNTLIGSDSGATSAGVTTGNNNTFVGNTVNGVTTGSASTVIGKVTGLSATMSNTIIVADGLGNIGFRKTDTGLSTAPSQTNALITGDSTGKAIITKEYLATFAPTLQAVTTAGNVISATVSGDNITNTIQANQIRLRNVTQGAPIITINMSGYSVSSSTGLAVYGATTLTSGGIGHALPTTSNAGKIVTVGTTAPVSATATGEVGEIRVTSTYIYTCIATDTWVRAAVATW